MCSREIYYYPTSLLSSFLLASIVLTGFLGSGDPLRNVLPLFIWTVWWIGVVALQGLLGNLWPWINPWSGIHKLLRQMVCKPASWTVKLPATTGAWPAVVIFILFMGYFLASVTLNSPSDLAEIICAYWAITLVGMLIFSEKIWLRQFECFSIFLYLTSLVSPVGRVKGTCRIGLPGWKIYDNKEYSTSIGTFSLIMLGCGSFDGLNETFWWLTTIGVNPLDFPGRSAIRVETLTGLLTFNALLISVFATSVWCGLALVRHQTKQTSRITFQQAFSKFALTLLPIAFAYHMAHFMTVFLVNIQYLPHAISDPLSSGSNYLSLTNYHVQLGFLTNHHTVETIWRTQVAIVVIGHVVSVVLAHAVSVDLFKHTKAAVISQAPLVTFMTAYTCLGLWLLSSPRIS